MAVEGEGAFKSAELNVDLGGCTGAKNGGVALELLLREVIRCWFATIDGLQLMRFQVDVNWMPPAATAVDQRPLFGGPKRHGDVGNLGIPVHLVNQPHTIAAHKFKGAMGADLRVQDGDVRPQQRVAIDGVGGGGGSWRAHHDFHDAFGEAGAADRFQIALGPFASVLFGGVDQVEDSAGCIGRKIHHKIGSVRRCQDEIRHLDWIGQ